MDNNRIEELIQCSSFGTPEARSLSDHTPDEIARRIVDRVRDDLKRPETEKVPGPPAPEAAAGGLLATVRAQLLAACVAWEDDLERGENASGSQEAAGNILAKLEATLEAEFEAARTAHEQLASILMQRLLHEWEWRTAGQLLDPLRLAAANAVIHGLDSDLTRLDRLLTEPQRFDACSAAARALVHLRPDTAKTWLLAGLTGSHAHHTPVRRCMLAFDIEGFSRPGYSTRLAMRTALRDLLSHSLSDAGIDWTQMELADFGDGALVLLDPRVSKTRPLHPLILQLAGRLTRHNSSLGPTERLRLRVVVHSGEVQRTEDGFVGEDLDLAFRLLSARALRNRLAHSKADLALIISDQFYKRIVAQADQAMGTSFQPVQIRAKAGTTRAWVGLRPEDGDSSDSSSATLGGGPPQELCRPM